MDSWFKGNLSIGKWVCKRITLRTWLKEEQIMPLYMDIHTVTSGAFTVEDVVKAHMQDLAIQERFGVNQIKYWVNVEAKTLFCLMEGPNKDACNRVHKESHGNTACNIIEVTEDEFNLFLGEGNSDNDLARTGNGDIDTGYRTLLLLGLFDLTGQYGKNNNDLYKLVEQHQGVVIIQPEDDMMVSFVYASDAINCALAIGARLKSMPHNTEFNLSLVSGRPVDELGNNLFEEAKKKVRYISESAPSETMYLDSYTKALFEKECGSSDIKMEDFKIVSHQQSHFLIQLFDVLNHRLPDPVFKSEHLNALLGSSKSQTYRKIKLLTGLAPNRFIQEVRLRRSLKLLKQKNKSVAEIAYDTGFNSPAYFAKVFRNRFHITPTCFSKLFLNT